MQCIICKNGSTQLGNVTVTLERNNCIIIIKNVPAQVCINCGEYYLSETVTEQVLQRAETSISQGVEVEILQYVA